MKSLRFLPLLMALVLLSEIGAYVTSVQVRSVRNTWGTQNYYPNSGYGSNPAIAPACTLRAELKPYGARATLDLSFKAEYSGFSIGDSLEIISQMTLPAGATVDSMILWIFGNEEPARHISVGQANATYNDIVVVTRRDPAFLKRTGYSYENNSYELKVFPIFRDSTRHVRIFIHYPLSQNGDTVRAVSLGKAHPAAVFLTPGTGVDDIPTSSDGSLKLQMLNGSLVLRAASEYGKEVKIFYGKGNAAVEPGVFGYVDATFPDTGYFHLEADFSKLFNLTNASYAKRVTFVWVPSTSYSSYPNDAFVVERNLFADYLKTFEREDDFNFYYAGASVIPFQAHMVPGTAAFKNDAGLFLNGVPAPSSPYNPREYFEALKAAFASIAAADTPAVVACMDREAPYGSGMDYAKINQMVTALVQINVNRARFYAWVHPSKIYFYSQLAQSLNGTMIYNLSTLDDQFKPQIKNPKITFITPVWDVLDLSAYGYSYYYSYPYYYNYSNYNNQFKYEGKCPKGPLLMDASIEMGSTIQKKRIYIGGMGTQDQGATVHKSWTQGLVSAIRTSYYGSTVQNPTPGTAALWSAAASSVSTYKTLVNLSIQKGVLTDVTALLALEPGMQLSEEDNPGNAGWGVVATGMEQLKKCRTADSCVTQISAVPNPFNPSTRIEVSGLGGISTVDLMIYSVDGKLVQKIVSQVNGGRAYFEWKGRGLRGERLSSGVYVARILAGNRLIQKQLYLTK